MSDTDRNSKELTRLRTSNACSSDASGSAEVGATGDAGPRKTQQQEGKKQQKQKQAAREVRAVYLLTDNAFAATDVPRFARLVRARLGLPVITAQCSGSSRENDDAGA